LRNQGEPLRTADLPPPDSIEGQGARSGARGQAEVVSGAVEGTVFQIMRFSIHDGPGIRTTVFLKGCHLRCRWCHNPEALSGDVEVLHRPERCLSCGDCVAVCTTGATRQLDGRVVTDSQRCDRCGACVEVCNAEARELLGRKMSVPAVMREIERDVPFFDESGGGVTFSGGEPLVQHAFLLALLTACRARRIHTAVDTTGFTAPDVLRRVAAVTDLFLYDLKSLDDRQHRDLTGVSNEPILANLRILSDEGSDVVVRIPVIPGYNDHAENIRRTGEFVAGLENVREVRLLPYHRTGLDKYRRLGMHCVMPDTAPPSPAALRQAAELLGTFGLTVGVGG